MRRGSLIGPVILILLGGLFLLNNLRPDLSVLDLIAWNWPYLLIGWGLLRLAEIVQWTRRSRPIPINGVTGGEWALVVLICLFGSGIFLAHDFHRSGWGNRNLFLRSIDVFGDAYDYPLTARQPAAGARRILVENLEGNVHIVGGDAPEIQVSGHKTVRALDKQKADAADRETPLEVELKDGQLIVRTNQHRGSSDSRVSADLEITVPRGLTVEGHGRRGDYDISQITGGVEIDSDNADVRLQSIGGPVRLDLRRGTLIRASNVRNSVDIKGRGQDVELEEIAGQVTINGTFTGELQFEKLAQPVQFKGVNSEFRAARVPGQVRISRSNINGNGVVGPTLLNSRSVDVQLSDFSQALEISVDRGDLDLAPQQVPLAKMSVRTRSGNIQLAVPESAKFELEGSSLKGEVDNQLGDGFSVDASHRGGTIRGRSGQGPLLSLTTDRGTLTVRKGGGTPAERSGAPVPPTPPAVPQPAPVEHQ